MTLFVILEVIMVVNVKTGVFWNATPYSLVHLLPSLQYSTGRKLRNTFKFPSKYTASYMDESNGNFVSFCGK
jgi:hypothetical protein